MIKLFLKDSFISLISCINRISSITKPLILEKGVISYKTKFSNHNRICKYTDVSNSDIGTHTYIGWNSTLYNCKIGAYTSIGPFVQVVYGTHPTHFVSTSPVFFSMAMQTGKTLVKENRYKEFNLADEIHSVIIGNDVWIGHSVKILEGITIGDGAIIATGAVVTKDVEPYSIVGGIPAKYIKSRFSDEHIAKLIKSSWWKRDEKWLIENAELFSDIYTFLDTIEGK